MLVFLFHNNDEILIRKYQKEFVEINYTTGSLLYPTHTLRPSLSELYNFSPDANTKEQLKIISQKIENLILQTPEWNNELQQLECPLMINFKDSTKKVITFPLIQNLSKQKKIAGNELTLPATLTFPKTIKTFRIGNQIDLDSNSSALTDYIWH